jgi:aromatic ring-cleaving dioxygenase
MLGEKRNDGRLVDPDRVRGYHAHVYYNPQTRGEAERLRQGIAARFSVELGRWRDEPVGSHPVSMYQVAFAPDQFARIVPWLMLNRSGLDILIHPRTGDSYADHATHAAWLGARLPLRLRAAA